jgi:DNA-binding NarL/FixJ family response regulator
MKRERKIIIVDDERLSRFGLISLFKNTGIKIIGEAENGEELFPQLKTKNPDVVLLDLEMPKLNGSKTLNRLRRDYPNQKVIILSKYHDEELIKDVFNRGANGFISKSNSGIDIVVSAIERVITYGIFKENIPALLKVPAEKNGHYYRLVLTQREIQIIGLLYQLKTYDQISKELFIAVNTVGNHLKSIFKKTGVKNREELILLMAKCGLNYMGMDT